MRANCCTLDNLWRPQEVVQGEHGQRWTVDMLCTYGQIMGHKRLFYTQYFVIMTLKNHMTLIQFESSFIPAKLEKNISYPDVRRNEEEVEWKSKRQLHYMV